MNQTDEEKFDMYIISSQTDLDCVKRNIRFIRENIDAQKIYIVTKTASGKLRRELPQCSFIDENSLLDNLNFNAVKDELAKYSTLIENSGWYFQQFLKLACAFVSENRYYLVWDADTIPLRKINFFDKDGKPFFNLKREFFLRYFYTIQNLFGFKKRTKESFISEHMLFDSNIVKELIRDIEMNPKLAGEFFWQKILFASFHFNGSNSGKQRNFSEYETYGTYCDYKKPNVYKKRKLATLRYGTEFLTDSPTAEVLEWAGKDFDTITFEHYEGYKPVTEIINISRNVEAREKNAFLHLLLQFQKKHRKQFAYKQRKALFTFNKKEIFEIRKQVNLFAFDFVFGKKLCYKKSFHFLEKYPILKKNYERLKLLCKIILGR